MTALGLIARLIRLPHLPVERSNDSLENITHNSRQKSAMKKLLLCTSIILLGSASQADTTLITNINGYTLNADRELQEFSAIQFTDETVDQLFQEDDSLPDEVDHRIDGGGQTLIPGLIDSHGHVLSSGLSLLRVDLMGSRLKP